MTERGRCDGSRVAILNVVGLCNRHLGEHTPRLRSFSKKTTGEPILINPVIPALTCSAQATYLTGTLPSEHGIVGNGWYDRTLNEHHFWKQSNRLVGGPKIWEKLRAERPGFRTANLFWWFNMYSSVDYSITPRPLYRSDGLKTFDVHAHPLKIREESNATSVPSLSFLLGPESRDRVIPMDRRIGQMDGRSTRTRPFAGLFAPPRL